ncbi:MAG TPA: hypothetical protein VJB59_01240 [Bdellovibrionota bacterium]|nr:hypothetical protein [Bdellovibrionota bacterium]
MIRKLSEVSDIYLGQPIRDRIVNAPDGDHFIVQIKDADKDSGIMTETLYRTHVKGRVGPRLIKRGDLLFVSRVFRGSLPYSVLVNADLPNLVAAPTFYILSVNKDRVRPEYLHWFINSELYGGRFFKQNAMGSSVLNIPKNVLSEMEVVLPTLQEQDRFIKLIQAAQLEKEIMGALVQKRRAFMDGIIKSFSN